MLLGSLQHSVASCLSRNERIEVLNKHAYCDQESFTFQTLDFTEATNLASMGQMTLTQPSLTSSYWVK